MSEPFIGQITMFGGNFAPRGWAFCNGQLLSISQNTALFSLLGTIYGGDGETTFALPELRGRVPMHWGNGPGLSSRNIGEKSGVENVILTTNQIPSHTHSLRVKDDDANQGSPVNNVLANANIYSNATPDAGMSAGAMLNTGGGQQHTNVQPFQCVSFIIALQGIYPSPD